MSRLDGRIAVVTGAASGIGRASALHFLALGARVVAGDCNAAALERLGEEAAAAGHAGRLRTIAGDVRSEADVAAAIALAGTAFGGLDIVYCNAGVGGAVGPLVETEGDDWDYTQAVLLRSVFLGFKHGARAMIAQQRGGVLLATASVAGLVGGCGPLAYSVAKAGVAHLVRMAAAELAVHRIRVAAVAPGGINTPMMHRGDPAQGRALLALTQPWPEAGLPEDVAAAAAFLAGDAARFVTGEVLVVDGGLVAHGSGLTTRFAETGPLAGMVGRDTGETGEAPILRPAAA